MRKVYVPVELTLDLGRYVRDHLYDEGPDLDPSEYPYPVGTEVEGYCPVCNARFIGSSSWTKQLFQSARIMYEKYMTDVLEDDEHNQLVVPLSKPIEEIIFYYQCKQCEIESGTRDVLNPIGR